MKTRRPIIEIDEELCDGCGQCVPACEEGAIQIIDGKARLVAEKLCDGLGACLGHCPRGAIRMVEREAEAFDEEAVKEHLQKGAPPKEASCACPGAQMQFFSQAPASALGHWPIQLRLVPPQAPFLQGARLLLAADCVGFAHPAFHQEFLPGRALLIGCPKFDDPEAYVEKLAAIFEEASPKEIQIVVMEVPCCKSFVMIVKKALEKAGKRQNFKVVVISVKGEVLGEEVWQ